MKDQFRKRTSTRTKVLAFLLLLWVGVLLGRLVQLQVLRHNASRAEVLEQSRNTQELRPQRGTIYDRNGKILGRSLPARSIFLTPQKSEGRAAQVQKLAVLKPVLGLSEAELQSIRSKIDRGDRFIYLKRKASPGLAARVKALDLRGVSSHAETKRFYPHGALAAHVLGGVNIDDVGLAGVELSYNTALEGKTGRAVIQRDARRREYYLETLAAAEPGQDIRLTIDETLQYIAETELAEAVEASRAEWGTVILANPGSGEILAMANWPSYDPNAFSRAEPSARINRAVQYLFEPGSLFKIVTASAALELHAVGLAESFDCSRRVPNLSGKDIRDHESFGVLTFSEVLIHSSNRGIAQVGQRLGPDGLYAAAKAYRFGARTGIDLPGEERGILYGLQRWSRRTVFSLSMGYEVSSTALQALQAANVLANRGQWVKPRVVKSAAGPAGSPKGNPDEPGQRVMSEESALKLTAVLERAVSEGTGVPARLEGFRIAGKTGTTQKFDPVLRTYTPFRHIASFVGFVPADDPLLSVIVVIDEPKGDLYYGGQVAAPVFREIVRRALLYLQVFPEKTKPRGLITAQLRSQAGR